MMIMFDFGPIKAELKPFPQSAPYAAAMLACGGQVFTADLSCGQAQVVQRGRLRLISRGPVWDTASTLRDQRNALRRLARWPGVTIATPEGDLRGLGLIPLVTPLHHAVWDLSGDLRAGLRGNWRRQLASAERHSIRARKGSMATLAHLVDADAAQGRARGYRGYSAEFTMALPADALRLWEWRHRGQIGAGMVFVVDGSSASYHISWSGPEARKRGVHNVMLWQAALALRDEGVRWLDLGSVNDEEAPGLASFKLGTGATLRRLGHTMLVLPG
jgi:Acetyltransferase (GNAT) domain